MSLWRVRAFNRDERDDVRYDDLELDEVLDATRDLLVEEFETILIDTAAADLRFDVDASIEEED